MKVQSLKKSEMNQSLESKKVSYRSMTPTSKSSRGFLRAEKVQIEKKENFGVDSKAQSNNEVRQSRNHKVQEILNELLSQKIPFLSGEQVQDRGASDEEEFKSLSENGSKDLLEDSQAKTDRQNQFEDEESLASKARANLIVQTLTQQRPKSKKRPMQTEEVNSISKAGNQTEELEKDANQLTFSSMKRKWPQFEDSKQSTQGKRQIMLEQIIEEGKIQSQEKWHNLKDLRQKTSQWYDAKDSNFECNSQESTLDSKEKKKSILAKLKKKLQELQLQAKDQRKCLELKKKEFEEIELHAEDIKDQKDEKIISKKEKKRASELRYSAAEQVSLKNQKTSRFFVDLLRGFLRLDLEIEFCKENEFYFAHDPYMFQDQSYDRMFRMKARFSSAKEVEDLKKEEMRITRQAKKLMEEEKESGEEEEVAFASTTKEYVALQFLEFELEEGDDAKLLPELIMPKKSPPKREFIYQGAKIELQHLNSFTNKRQFFVRRGYNCYKLIDEILEKFGQVFKEKVA